MVCYGKQSPDIKRGVDQASDDYLNQGAGDQGLMFGYACDDAVADAVPDLLRAPPRAAAERGAPRRAPQFLRPDAKSQVTVRYVDGRPHSVETVVLSTQHHPSMNEKAGGARRGGDRGDHQARVPGEHAEGHALPREPTGRFEIGGPHGDAGVTGRKIIVDTYGGAAPARRRRVLRQGPSKVDRSAAYAARYVAKNIVAAGIARQCQVQVAYAIGVAKPMNVTVYTEGTGKLPDEQIADLVQAHFDLRPKGIVRMLDLLRPIYRKTAAYGHFGRDEPEFTWERVDKRDVLRDAAGIKRCGSRALRRSPRGRGDPGARARTRAHGPAACVPRNRLRAPPRPRGALPELTNAADGRGDGRARRRDQAGADLNGIYELAWEMQAPAAPTLAQIGERIYRPRHERLRRSAGGWKQAFASARSSRGRWRSTFTRSEAADGRTIGTVHYDVTVE